MANLQDSGARREFGTGAVRDIAEGKGRCDLLPLMEVADAYFNHLQGDYYNYRMLYKIAMFVRGGNTDELAMAIREFSEKAFGDYSTAIIEVSKHYEDGASKYSERNWEKGIPLHCFIDSAVRHYLKYIRGDKDERHDRAFLWNLLGAIWTLDNHPELNDLPFGEKKEENDDY